MQHGFGPDDDLGVGDLGRRGVDVDDPRARYEPLELFADAGHTRPQDPQLGGAALRAHQRSLVGAVPSQQVPTGCAHEEAESTPAVEHADCETVRTMQRGRQGFGQQARPGRLLAPVDHLDPRPPRRFDVGRGTLDAIGSAARDQGLDGRHRRTHDERRTTAPGPFVQHVARVPGGRALLLQGLVGVVDDDRRLQVGDGCERRDPAAHDDTRSLARPDASLGCVPRPTRTSATARRRDLAQSGTRPAPSIGPRRRRTRSSNPPPGTAAPPAPGDRAAAADG